MMVAAVCGLVDVTHHTTPKPEPFSYPSAKVLAHRGTQYMGCMGPHCSLEDVF